MPTLDSDKVDSGIQINNIQKSNLPLLDSENRYLLRYRIKNLDGTSTTAWSPVYRVTKPSIDPIFNKTTGTHMAEVEAKSHGKSFDVSWKITNKITQLTEIPEQIVGLPLDAYVRWGGLITDVSYIGTVYTITVNYKHNFIVGQVITAEGTTEDEQQNYTVLAIVDDYSFTIQTTGMSTTYLEIGNRLWSKWEYVTTTTANSFSVPIPEHHQSLPTVDKYAEFMVHLATFVKDRQETLSSTMIFYTDSVSTRATYDAGSIL